MQYIVRFLVVFFLFFLSFLFFVILRKKNKKYNHKNQKMEEIFLIRKHKINIKKLNYRKFLFTIHTIDSIIFALTFTVIGGFDKLLFKLMFAPILLFPLILISYTLLGKYYVKKGFDKHVSL